MREEIEKFVTSEVMRQLGDLDIEGMITKATGDKEVNEIIQRKIKERISQVIEQKVYSKITENNKLIDAWAVSKVESLLYELGLK